MVTPAFLVFCFLTYCRNGGNENPIRFAPGPSHGKHIAVRPTKDALIINVCIAVQRCPKETVFARVRCSYPDGTSERLYFDTKTVTANRESDKWSFFLRAPRFQSGEEVATYQVEIGYLNSKNVDEDMITDSFGWKMVKGKMVSKIGLDDICIPIERRAIVVKGEKYVITTVYSQGPPLTALTYAVLETLPEFIPGELVAQRIK
jgi:hypothetical protein